jgi:hypothetical protein
MELGFSEIELVPEPKCSPYLKRTPAATIIGECSTEVRMVLFELGPFSGTTGGQSALRSQTKEISRIGRHCAHGHDTVAQSLVCAPHKLENSALVIPTTCGCPRRQVFATVSGSWQQRSCLAKTCPSERGWRCRGRCRRPSWQRGAEMAEPAVVARLPFSGARTENPQILPTPVGSFGQDAKVIFLSTLLARYTSQSYTAGCCAIKQLTKEAQ